MRILKNLWLVTLSVVFITIPGCNESQQASTTPKISPKAEKPAAMNYDIEEKDAFTVMGIQTRITSADEKNPDTYTKIWDAFEPYRTQVRPISVNWASFGIAFATKQKDTFDYLAGMSVRSDAAVPDPNLVTRTAPAARYAVFKCSAQDIGKTYQYIFNQWLPNSRYEINTAACSFEQYAPKEWENRPVFIHIPVLNKGKQ